MGGAEKASNSGEVRLSDKMEEGEIKQFRGEERPLMLCLAAFVDSALCFFPNMWKKGSGMAKKSIILR